MMTKKNILSSSSWVDQCYFLETLLSYFILSLWFAMCFYFYRCLFTSSMTSMSSWSARLFPSLPKITTHTEITTLVHTFGDVFFCSACWCTQKMEWLWIPATHSIVYYMLDSWYYFRPLLLNFSAINSFDLGNETMYHLLFYLFHHLFSIFLVFPYLFPQDWSVVEKDMWKDLFPFCLVMILGNIGLHCLHFIPSPTHNHNHNHTSLSFYLVTYFGFRSLFLFYYPCVAFFLFPTTSWAETMIGTLSLMHIFWVLNLIALLYMFTLYIKDIQRSNIFENLYQLYQQPSWILWWVQWLLLLFIPRSTSLQLWLWEDNVIYYPFLWWIETLHDKKNITSDEFMVLRQLLSCQKMLWCRFLFLPSSTWVKTILAITLFFLVSWIPLPTSVVFFKNRRTCTLMILGLLCVAYIFSSKTLYSLFLYILSIYPWQYYIVCLLSVSTFRFLPTLFPCFLYVISV